MINIGRKKIVNFKKITYVNELDILLTRAMKKQQPEDNTLTQESVYMQANIKDVEVNYYSKSIIMDSELASIGIENRCTVCILNTTKTFVGELVDFTRYIKEFGGTRSPLIKKGTLQWK